MDSKDYNKLVNKTKKKQTHRNREETSVYQWGEERGVGHKGVGGKKGYYGLYEVIYMKLLKIVKHYRI